MAVEEVIYFVGFFYRVERRLSIAKILETLGAWWPHFKIDFKTKENLFEKDQCSKSVCICFFKQEGKQFKIDTF